MDSLHGLVAAVTGGASGIGRACAAALAAAGARVTVGDLDGAGAARTGAEILARGAHAARTGAAPGTAGATAAPGTAAAAAAPGTAGATAARANPAAPAATGCAVDVTNRADVAAWLDATIREWGRLDVVVHSAGICPLADFESLTDGDWDRVMAVNLRGSFIVSQEAFRRMKAGGGRIIHISSMAGEQGGLLVGAHYAASKGGIVALAKCIARAGAPHGILCNCVSPGTTDTPMTQGWPQEQRQTLVQRTPLGRLARAEDVAGAVAWLAGPAASFVTGQVIRVNGGMYM